MKMNNPIIMHINYFEQGQSIDYTVRRAKELGYDGIEFRRARKLEGETVESYLDEIKRASDRYEMRHIYFGAPGVNAVTKDASALEADIDGYKRFIDEADKRGLLSVVNMMTGWISATTGVGADYDHSGSFAAEEWMWESSAKAVQAIADYAPNVKFAFETHMGYIHDLPSTARRLVDMIDRPNVGVNLDYGNSVYFAKANCPTLANAIETCGEKLFYTHLKNSVAGNPGRRPTALSQGEINHREYLMRLREMGYDGPIGVEAPRPGDREYFAAEDMAYIKTLVEY